MAPRVTPNTRVKVPLRRKQGKDGPGVKDGRWWALATEEARGAAMWETVTILNKAHMPRHMDDAIYTGLYENRPPYWSGVRSDPLLTATVLDGVGRRVPLNLVKSVIDTAAAQLSKNLAELKAFTSGGSWRDQRKAKQITKFNSGAFYLNEFHRHQQRAFRDGCTSKARGAVEFWGDRKSGMVRCSRIHPRTLLWNELEGDSPRSLYRRFPIARETLIRRFPKHRATIEKCEPSDNPVNPAYRRTPSVYAYADMVDVAVGWHLGYRGEEDSGRYIVRVEKGSLYDKPYPNEIYPLATFSWDDADEGWGGIPLADTLAGFQSEVNSHLRIYRKALMRAASMAGAWVEATSNTSLKGENNNGEPWSERTYVGKEPVFAAPPALGRDFFEYILFVYDKAFAEAGFSMLQAQGEKPDGVDAAVALRELNDITSTRQVPKGQRWERMTEQAGQIQMMIARELFTGPDKVSVKVRAPGTRFLEEVDFADVADVEEDAYVLKNSATSELPSHFIGRMQTVSEMIRSGVIPEEKVKSGLGLRLLNMPDLEKEVDIETSARELTSMQVDLALYEGKWVAPEPYQSPELLLEVAQNSYLFAKTLEGVPRKNMRLLERLISEADAIRKRSAINVQGPPLPGSSPGAAAMQPGPPPQVGVPVSPQQPGKPVIPLAPTPAPPVPGVPSAMG